MDWRNELDRYEQERRPRSRHGDILAHILAIPPQAIEAALGGAAQGMSRGQANAMGPGYGAAVTPEEIGAAAIAGMGGGAGAPDMAGLANELDPETLEMFANDIQALDGGLNGDDPEPGTFDGAVGANEYVNSARPGFEEVNATSNFPSRNDRARGNAGKSGGECELKPGDWRSLNRDRADAITALREQRARFLKLQKADIKSLRKASIDEVPRGMIVEWVLLGSFEDVYGSGMATTRNILRIVKTIDQVTRKLNTLSFKRADPKAEKKNPRGGMYTIPGDQQNIYVSKNYFCITRNNKELRLISVIEEAFQLVKNFSGREYYRTDDVKRLGRESPIVAWGNPHSFACLIVTGHVSLTCF